jgi:hypothetical protein
MARCRVDKTIERVEVGGFAFPLGAYPIEPMQPREGYTLAFEAADGSGENGEWEEWPDRYVFDVLITATRVEALCRALFAMLPGRVYPILDVLGHDEYREVDPYVSYDLVGQERVQDSLRRYRAYFFEDGLIGFGAMSEEPFAYVFVDEHKIVTVRVETELREKVEKILSAFDLSEVEEICGADAATHEHRGVLDCPEDRPDLLTAEEIVEELRDEWGLVLNIDGDRNVDDEDNDLGMTGWRCVARHDPMPPEEAAEAEPTGRATDPPPPAPRSRYIEVLLTADCLGAAEQLLWESVESLTGTDSSPEMQDVAIAMDRLTPEHFAEAVAATEGKPTGVEPSPMDEAKVWAIRWLD